VQANLSLASGCSHKRATEKERDAKLEVQQAMKKIIK
jgi:hypothetical protein